MNNPLLCTVNGNLSNFINWERNCEINCYSAEEIGVKSCKNMEFDGKARINEKFYIEQFEVVSELEIVDFGAVDLNLNVKELRNGANGWFYFPKIFNLQENVIKNFKIYKNSKIAIFEKFVMYF